MKHNEEKIERERKSGNYFVNPIILEEKIRTLKKKRLRIEKIRS